MNLHGLQLDWDGQRTILVTRSSPTKVLYPSIWMRLMGWLCSSLS